MIVLFNKPYGVLCQFTDRDNRPTLADYVQMPGVYAAGRLDKDSEGLLLLTDDADLQHRLTHPRRKTPKTYLVQVEHRLEAGAVRELLDGVQLNDGPARVLRAEVVAEPHDLWPRTPPVRYRKTVATSWLRLSISEGRNRQVRRMTAAVGHPTLRLIRLAIGEYRLGELQPGEWRIVET